MNTPILFAQAAQPAAVQAAPAPAAAPAAAPATTATEVQPTTDGAAAPAQPQQQGGGMGLLVPMILLFAIFYFMMIKPQQRREKERQKMINELRAGTKVVFADGLIGKIVEAKDKTFRIELAQDVIIEVARSSVQAIVTEEQPAAK